MKTFKTFLTILVISPLFILPQFLQAQEVLSKEISIASFSELELEGVYNVYLNQGPKEKFVLKGNQNFLSSIDFSVKGDRVSIVHDDKSYKNKKGKSEIHITFKNLNALDLSIIGNLKSSEKLHLDKIRISSSQVGGLDLDLNCTHLDLELTNVGNTNIQGTANEVNIEFSGVGELNTSLLKSNKVDLENSGVGNVKLSAVSALNINSTGIGNVQYQFSGKQENLNISSSGIGKVRQK